MLENDGKVTNEGMAINNEIAIHKDRAGNYEHKYDDIIHLPHHQSTTHPHMSIHDRAAQFAPFAALTGHDAAIRETARLTDERVELDENEISQLNMRLQWVQERMDEQPKISVTYFEPDERKDGGSYRTFTGNVKKIDHHEQCIEFMNGKKIPIADLVVIQ